MQTETSVKCDLEYVGHGGHWDLSPRKSFGVLNVIMLLVIISVPAAGVTATIFMAPPWARVVIPVVVGVPTLAILIAAFVNLKTEIAKGPLVSVRGETVSLPRHQLQLTKSQVLAVCVELGGMTALFSRDARLSAVAIEYCATDSDTVRVITLVEGYAGGARSSNISLARRLAERLEVPWREL